MYVAWHPELPGCTAQGDTFAQAVAFLSDAFQTYAEHFTEFSTDMPVPDVHRVSEGIWEEAAWPRLPNRLALVWQLPVTRRGFMRTGAA